MKQKGYVLIELLTAAVLFSLAGSGLYTSFMQGVKADKKLRQFNSAYLPVESFGIKIEKDLRNAAELRGFEFQGKKGELIFPVFQINSLSRIRYFSKGGNLHRLEEKIPKGFSAAAPEDRMLLRGIESFEIHYAYLDESDRLQFFPIWAEEPYRGIPKAVRIKVKLNGRDEVWTKFVSIPRGKWGRKRKGTVPEKGTG